jgi:hypothetical protein
MQQKKINPWSLVAGLSAIGFCPLFTIAAILFGIRALVDIKAKGDTRGIRLAWFAILFGSLITGLWGGGMLWWNTNVRARIEQGPITAIMRGQAGEIESFQDAFTSRSSGEEAAVFLAALHSRYGALLRGNLDKEIGEVAVEGDKLFLGMVPVEAELEYVLEFSNSEDVHLIGKFELFETVDGGSEFKNRFVWIRIDDIELGTLVYPADEVNVEQSGK